MDRPSKSSLETARLIHPNLPVRDPDAPREDVVEATAKLIDGAKRSTWMLAEAATRKRICDWLRGAGLVQQAEQIERLVPNPWPGDE
jgi:hypothetical protein